MIVARSSDYDIMLARRVQRGRFVAPSVGRIGGQEEIIALATVNLIGTRAASQYVGTIAAGDLIIASVAVQRGSAVGEVSLALCDHDVVITLAALGRADGVDRVVSGTANHVG